MKHVLANSVAFLPRLPRDMHVSKCSYACHMSSEAGGLTVPGLDGAAVIVTGGGRGIGAATARQPGLAGAAVVLVGRRPGLLDEVAAGITAGGGRGRWTWEKGRP